MYNSAFTYLSMDGKVIAQRTGKFVQNTRSELGFKLCFIQKFNKHELILHCFIVYVM